MKTNVYKIGKSKIEGKGVLATVNLEPGSLVGQSHQDGQPSSELGMYYNHSEKPNAVSHETGGSRFVIISKPTNIANIKIVIVVIYISILITLLI